MITVNLPTSLFTCCTESTRIAWWRAHNTTVIRSCQFCRCQCERDDRTKPKASERVAVDGPSNERKLDGNSYSKLLHKQDLQHYTSFHKATAETTQLFCSAESSRQVYITHISHMETKERESFHMNHNHIQGPPLRTQQRTFSLKSINSSLVRRNNKPPVRVDQDP